MAKSNQDCPTPTAYSKVVSEIRASLFHATTALSEDVLDHFSSTTTEAASISNNDNSGSAAVSLSIATFSAGPAAAAVAPPRLECGSLKYSHVKGKWILRHKPIRFRTTTAAMSSSNQNSAGNRSSHISRTPIEGHSQSIASMIRVAADYVKDATGEERSDVDKMCCTIPAKSICHTGRKRNHPDEEISDISGITSSLPSGSSLSVLSQQPPLELVQCLLRGAELIAMMEQVKAKVSENSNRTDGAPVQCWSRVRRGPINLHPALLAALQKDSTTTNQNDDCENGTVSCDVLNECINCAYIYSVDLAAVSNSDWDIHFAEDLLPSAITFAKDRPITRRVRRQKRTKADAVEEAAQESDKELRDRTNARLGVHEFVKYCLSPPWDKGEFTHLATFAGANSSHKLGIVDGKQRSRKASDIPNSPLTPNRMKRYPLRLSDSLQYATYGDSTPSAKEGLPLKERSNRIHITGLGTAPVSITDDSLSSRLKSQVTLQRKSESAIPASLLSIEGGGKLEETSKPSTSTVKKSPKKNSWHGSKFTHGKRDHTHSPASSSSLLGMFDNETNDIPSEILSVRKERNGHDNAFSLASPEHSCREDTSFVSSGAIAHDARHSPRKKQYKWNDQWESLLMKLGSGKKDGHDALSSPSCNKLKTENIPIRKDVKTLSQAPVGDIEYFEASTPECDNADMALEIEAQDPSNDDGDLTGIDDDAKSFQPTNEGMCDRSHAEKEKNVSDKKSGKESVDIALGNIRRNEVDSEISTEPEGAEPGNDDHDRPFKPENILPNKATNARLRTGQNVIAENHCAETEQLLIKHADASMIIETPPSEEFVAGGKILGEQKIGTRGRRTKRPLSKETAGSNWETWEHMEFLRLLKLQGREKLSLIAKSIPTRTITQIKMHAEVTMQKMDEGIDIFQGLQEYLENPPAFANPSDDHFAPFQPANSSIMKIGCKKAQSNSWTMISVPTNVVRTNWVKLAHQGHISDYHFYGRKYEQFYNLKYGNSILEVKEEISKTLNDHFHEIEDDTDEDIEGENAAYSRGVQIIEDRAKEERLERKKKSEAARKEAASLENIPILFSLGNRDELVDTCVAEGCNVCTGLSSVILDLDESSITSPLKFKYFDKEDEDIVQVYSDEAGGDEKKRRSRTAQIAVQKKASIKLLNEMLHTLNFIDNYNNGFKGEMPEDGAVDEEKNEATETEDGEETGNVPRDLKRKGSAPLKISGKRARTTNETEEEPHSEVFEALFEPLTHTRHIVNYAETQRNNRYYYPVASNGRIESTSREIACILHKTASELKGYFQDEAVVAEEKAVARGIRGYGRKADQEKMEKKEFAEKQQQQLRLYEYYTAKKKRKESPQAVELKQMDTRHFQFIGLKDELPGDTQACPYRPRCPMCAPVLHGERPYEEDAIFNPTFRQVIDRDRYIADCDKPEAAEEEEPGKYCGRAAERRSQKIISALQLSELYHTFQFIDSYNKGMIAANKE